MNERVNGACPAPRTSPPPSDRHIMTRLDRLANEICARVFVPGMPREEILNETYVHLLEAMSSGVDDDGALLDLVSDKMRAFVKAQNYRTRRVKSRDDFDPVDKSPPPEAAVFEGELYDAVKALLSDNEFFVIEQRFRYSLSYKEIAQELGLKEKTVVQYKSNAVKKIREKLKISI